MLLRWWILGAMAVGLPAQTLTTINSHISYEPGITPLVEGADGNLYGTTGSNEGGSVFKITPGGTLTTLYTFTNGADGAAPNGLVQATDGNFYGITNLGGSGRFGTVFKVTPAGTLTTLHTFSGGGDNGGPEAPLVQASDGNLYGTTQGTVFKITLGGTLTTLYTFNTGVDGGAPQGALVQATDGNLYGTNSGGATILGNGTVFKITPAGAFTKLHTFTGGSDGASPDGALIQATDGNLYGTTSGGGANSGQGTVFKITPAGTLTTLYTFTGNNDGASPLTPLIQATDGNFYGTTSGGGSAGQGTIFKITPGGTLTTLYTFTGGNDGGHPGGLVEGADGNLYGADQGGANGGGTVFKLQLGLPPASSTPTIALVQNAEGGAATIAPNTWVTLKGSNLAPAGDSRIWQASDFVNNELPTQLDGVSVKLNGKNAYVYYISPTQINILTPPDLATGTVQVQAATSAGTSASFAAQAQAGSPSFFIFGGGPYVVATHTDGNLIGPTSLYPGLSTPAQPGETIVLYANGFGPTSTPVVSGSEAQSGSLNPLPVVTIGSNPAPVQFAGLISPGLFQFNVVVPAATPAGDNVLTATYGGLTTQAGVLVTVAP